MRLTANWIKSPDSQAVCAALAETGFQAFFVGGCVRNTLLGVAVSDIDIATDARPEQVMEAAQNAGLRAVPTGADHGTITVVSGGTGYEVTTFRKDVATDGRRAVVSFADDPATDARRRDFTMNALYATPDGDVLDPLGGLVDLTARRVRFIGTPEARINEDYLRILRFFRFHAWYGAPDAGLDPDGLAACSALSAGIETLSRERVGAEIVKLLAAPDPGPSAAAMAASGILGRVLPGADARSLPVLVHLEEVAGVKPDPMRRLAVTGGEDAVARLRLCRQDAARLDRLRGAAGSSLTPIVLGYRLGARDGVSAVLLRAALTENVPAGDWQGQIEAGAGAQFPVRAADLMPGLTGSALGAKLKELESLWLDSALSLDRDALLARAFGSDGTAL